MKELERPGPNIHPHDSGSSTESFTTAVEEDSTLLFESNGWVLRGISDELPPLQENELWVQVIPKEIPGRPYVVCLKKIASLEDLNDEIDSIKSVVAEFSVFTPTRKHKTSSELSWKALDKEHIPEQLVGLYPEEKKPDKSIQLNTNEINEKIKRLGPPPKRSFDWRLNRDLSNSAWNAIKDLPVDILRRYSAHGSARGERFEHAIRILETNALTGYVAPLAGGAEGAATTPYYDGCMLVVSKRDIPLDAKNNKKSITVEIIEGEKVINNALELNAGAFVISDHYRSYVGPLRAMYPNANILYAEELRNYILEQERIANTESVPDSTDEAKVRLKTQNYFL